MEVFRRRVGELGRHGWWWGGEEAKRGREAVVVHGERQGGGAVEGVLQIGSRMRVRGIGVAAERLGL